MLKCNKCKYENNQDSDKNCLYCGEVLTFILDTDELFELLKEYKIKPQYIKKLDCSRMYIRIIFDSITYISHGLMFGLVDHYKPKNLLIKGLKDGRTGVWIRIR